jgi:hypothetical protein
MAFAPWERDEEITARWQATQVEPVMIRFAEGTGLTLRRSGPRQLNAPRAFLCDGQRLHLARSREGLIDLLQGPLGDLTVPAGAPRTAKKLLQPTDVVVLFAYDFPVMIETLPNKNDLGRFVGVLDLCRELAELRIIDHVAAQLAPVSDLQSFCYLIEIVRSDNVLRDAILGTEKRAWRKIRQFDVQGILGIMTQVSNALSECIEWHS